MAVRAQLLCRAVGVYSHVVPKWALRECLKPYDHITIQLSQLGGVYALQIIPVQEPYATLLVIDINSLQSGADACINVTTDLSADVMPHFSLSPLSYSSPFHRHILCVRWRTW